METGDLISTIADLGMVGIFILGAGGAAFFLRRANHQNHSTNNTSKELVGLLKVRDDVVSNMVRHQESMVGAQARLVEGQTKIQESIQRLVEIHIRTEEPMKRLEEIMIANEKQLHQANELEIRRVERERSKQ